MRAKTARELDSELAWQAREVAQLAKGKHAWARKAYVVIVACLAAWAIAPIALSFVGRRGID